MLTVKHVTDEKIVIDPVDRDVEVVGRHDVLFEEYTKEYMRNYETCTGRTPDVTPSVYMYYTSNGVGRTHNIFGGDTSYVMNHLGKTIEVVHV